MLLTAALLSGPRTLAEEPADARSVHLEWHTDAPAVTFYNEVTPTKSTNGTYFCVCAFESGYMGIQQVEDGSKKAIFSIWDSDDSKAMAVVVVL